MIGKDQLQVRAIVETALEDPIENIADIQMQISLLINSPGGSVRSGKILQDDLDLCRGDGDRVVAFAYPQALSAAAVLLISADESYVVDDTRILFHASYIPEKEYDGGSYHWKKTQLHGQTIYTTEVGDQLLDIRDQLKRSKTGDPQKFEPCIARALRENPEYPEVKFSGREAAEVGLVTESYATIEELHQKMRESVPTTILNHTEVKGFLSK